jgi:HK97 family phage portal protein
VSPALRPGSFLDRAFNGRQERSVPPSDTMLYSSSMGMKALFKPQQSLRAYGNNVWLYRSVLTIAMEIGGTEFKLRRLTKSGEYEYQTKHQALETLRRPQPTAAGKTMLTGMLLKVITGMHLLLNGEAFWLLDKRLTMGGAPTSVTPLLAQNMHLRLSDDGEVIEYIYRLQSREFRLDPMDVVHFRLPDPENMYRGHSPVQGIRFAVDTHQEADVMNIKRLENHGVPGGIVSTKTELSDDQHKKYRDQWRQMHGGSDNAGKVAFLPQGMDFKSVQQTNQDMQFVEGKQTSRDEILAAYGVGLEIMGKTESQTRANAEASIFVFQKFGVSPILKLMNDALSNDFLVAFPGRDGLEFCHDDPVPENQEEKRLRADNLFAGGALTPNERRKMFGMEPLDLPGMDTPYLDMGKMPVGEEPKPAPEMPTEEDEEEEPSEKP